jgi:hypothetical protein
MKKITIKQAGGKWNPQSNACKKQGCDVSIYVLPFAGTKELFEKKVQESIKEANEDVIVRKAA